MIHNLQNVAFLASGGDVQVEVPTVTSSFAGNTSLTYNDWIHQKLLYSLSMDFAHVPYNSPWNNIDQNTFPAQLFEMHGSGHPYGTTPPNRNQPFSIFYSSGFLPHVPYKYGFTGHPDSWHGYSPTNYTHSKGWMNLRNTSTFEFDPPWNSMGYARLTGQSVLENYDGGLFRDNYHGYSESHPDGSDKGKKFTFVVIMTGNAPPFAPWETDSRGVLADIGDFFTYSSSASGLVSVKVVTSTQTNRFYYSAAVGPQVEILQWDATDTSSPLSVWRNGASITVTGDSDNTYESSKITSHVIDSRSTFFNDRNGRSGWKGRVGYIGLHEGNLTQSEREYAEDFANENWNLDGNGYP